MTNTFGSIEVQRLVHSCVRRSVRRAAAAADAGLPEARSVHLYVPIQHYLIFVVRPLSHLAAQRSAREPPASAASPIPRWLERRFGAASNERLRDRLG